MTERKPRLALDMYLLGQDIKTGVYRVCDELFPRLDRSSQFETHLFVRKGQEERVEAYIAERGLRSASVQDGSALSSEMDIFLSPFGVAPRRVLRNGALLQAHIIYDLIAITRPEFFHDNMSISVRQIMASLDEHTVIFAISEYTKKDLLEHRPDLDPGQITVIPLAAGDRFTPCDDPQLRAAMRARYGIPPDVPYVLSLATLEIRKNLDQVVDSFVRYLEEHDTSDMCLVLAGMSGWKLEKLDLALAAAGRWRDRILLTGFVDDDDLAALYSDALCFVYLSRYEGFGLPPLEAMACGTPVICADNSSLPEVVGDAGVLVDADDLEGVVRAIHTIATSDRYRKELSRKGLRRAAEFDWDRCALIVSEAMAAAHERYAALPDHLKRQPLAGADQGGNRKSFRNRTKRALRGHPALYRIAKRLYVRLKA